MNILASKIRTEEWSEKPPRIVRDARFNIFLANEEQIKRWKSLLTFQPFLVFEYEHKFFLVEDNTASPVSYTDLNDWVAKMPSTPSIVENIRIVTDIEAEACAFRNELYIAFAKSNRTPPSEGVQIASSKERSPHNVFEWTFRDGPSKKIKRVFFFGTPPV